MHEPISLMRDTTFPNYARPNWLQSPLLKYLSESPCAKRVESLVEVELKQGPLPPLRMCSAPSAHQSPPLATRFWWKFPLHPLPLILSFLFWSFTFNWRYWTGNVHHASIHLEGFHHLDYVNFHSTQIACHHLFFDPIGGMGSNFPKLLQLWNFSTSS